MRYAVTAARQRLETLTPLKTDCGLLCGCACCAPDADGQGGMYLFPGEEALYEGADWARIGKTDDLGEGYLLVCEGRCPREMRPLACRIFPLTPLRTRSGEWSVRADARSRAMCPLSRCGTRGLDPAFVEAVQISVRELSLDPVLADFLSRWEAREREFQRFRL